jgi:RNA polymerase sigma-70 factor (ECF subfamily)
MASVALDYEQLSDIELAALVFRRDASAVRLLRLLHEQSVAVIDDYREALMANSDMARSPEADLMRRQVAKLLERAIAKLPETFRPVFVLRDVEELSVEETAEALQIPKETVKTRLLRARRRLQQELDPELRGALQDTFPFLGADCDALTERVLARFSPREPRAVPPPAIKR